MGISRRTLLKTGALAGAGVLLGSAGERMLRHIDRARARAMLSSGGYELMRPENVLYSTCLQCNTQCTIKVKVHEGLVVKIDGNPYSPVNLQPQLPYATPLVPAAKTDAPICPKGQTGVQTQYDPYRIRRVPKRAGPRGSNRWKAISFEQAIAEITEGGKLFADIGEDRVVPGFNADFDRLKKWREARWGLKRGTSWVRLVLNERNRRPGGAPAW